MEAYLINPSDSTVSFAKIGNGDADVLALLDCEKQDITFIDEFPQCELHIDAGGAMRNGNMAFRIAGDPTAYWGRALLVGFDIVKGDICDIPVKIDEVAETIMFFGAQSEVRCIGTAMDEAQADLVAEALSDAQGSCGCGSTSCCQEQAS